MSKDHPLDPVTDFPGDFVNSFLPGKDEEPEEQEDEEEEEED
jgi:hypothetical protein